MTTDWRALCAELVELDQAEPPDDFVKWRRQWIAAIKRAQAALAQPEPDYIDSEHTGHDREMLEEFYRACRSEGGSADEIHLRGLKAVIALSQSEPVPVDERLPEAEDCDGENQCWQWDPKSDAWVLYTSVGLRLRADVAPYWLPHHALPVPQDS